MSNTLRGQASFEIPTGKDGEGKQQTKTYLLHYTWNAAAAYEGATNRSISDALLDVGDKKLNATSLRAMLWAGLQEHHAEVSIREAGNMIEVLGRRRVIELMGLALKYFYPELEVDEPPPDPPPPAPST